MTLEISFEEGEKHTDWIGLTEALSAGHALPKAQISDSFLYRGQDTLLQRQAWIDGLGIAVKTVTVYPDNSANDLPKVNGAVTLFDDATGCLEALIDFHLVTKLKTAGDSLLAARRLARPDSRSILIIGAGTVGRSLRDAYGAAFPTAQFVVWNRSPSGAEQMAADYPNTVVVTDMEAAVKQADIITSATMSVSPHLKGEWLQPGQHVDLIGAYRPDMREADDQVMQRGRVFVDSFDTTINHIGELIEPLKSGALKRDDIVADFYQLDQFKRQSEDEITVFKNGGGAHLDLMASRYILDRWEAAH